MRLLDLIPGRGAARKRVFGLDLLDEDGILRKKKKKEERIESDRGRITRHVFLFLYLASRSFISGWSFSLTSTLVGSSASVRKAGIS